MSKIIPAHDPWGYILNDAMNHTSVTFLNELTGHPDLRSERQASRNWPKLVGCDSGGEKPHNNLYNAARLIVVQRAVFPGEWDKSSLWTRLLG
jgi:hypothetical protein